MDTTDPSEQLDVRIRARMAKQVLPTCPAEMDARTGFILKIADVLRIDLPNQMPEWIVKAIAEPTNPARLSSEVEPALVLQESDTEHQLLELHVALLNPAVHVRRAVLDELRRK